MTDTNTSPSSSGLEAGRAARERARLSAAHELAGRAWSTATDRAHEAGDATPAVHLDEQALDFLAEFAGEFGAAESFGHYEEAPVYCARYGSALLYGSGLTGDGDAWTVGLLYGHDEHASHAFEAFRVALINAYADALRTDTAGGLTLTPAAARAAAVETLKVHREV